MAFATHWLVALHGCPRAVVPEPPEAASDPLAPLQTYAVCWTSLGSRTPLLLESIPT